MEAVQSVQDPQKKKGHHDVMFKVFAPRALEPILMCFDRNTKVGEVADAASAQFHYEPGSYTLQSEKDEIFDRNKTLKEEGVDCGDHLELVATGGGVFLVPPPATLEFIKGEIESAQRLCQRKDCTYFWDEKNLELRVVLHQKNSCEQFYLTGSFSDYPALPPVWQFTDMNWLNSGNKMNYPKPEATKFGSSIFHSQPVICAPFNRLAYNEKGGPHGDWGGCANWKNINGNMVKALSIPDMLAVIFRDLAVTKGRLS